MSCSKHVLNADGSVDINIFNLLWVYTNSSQFVSTTWDTEFDLLHTFCLYI